MKRPLFLILGSQSLQMSMVVMITSIANGDEYIPIQQVTNNPRRHGVRHLPLNSTT